MYDLYEFYEQLGYKNNIVNSAIINNSNSSLYSASSTTSPPPNMSPFSLESSFRKQNGESQKKRKWLVGTVINLTGCVIGVIWSIFYEVLSYWIKVIHINYCC